MDTAAVIADPYVKEISEMLDVERGQYTWQRFPVQFVGFSPRLRHAPQRTEFDAEAVLSERGYSHEQIAALRAANVIEGPAGDSGK